jgi:hypothetical protein
MTNYTKEKAINDLLNEAEAILMESIGRYEAQRFIALFLNIGGKGFNLYQKIYEKGKEVNGDV